MQGNWFEELALKEVTGERYYPSPLLKESTLMTGSRVINHTEQELSKDYKSTTARAMGDPRQHREYKDQMDKPLGPRGALIEAMIKAKIDAETEQKQFEKSEESKQCNYTSATAQAYNIPGFKPFFG